MFCRRWNKNKNKKEIIPDWNVDITSAFAGVIMTLALLVLLLARIVIEVVAT